MEHTNHDINKIRREVEAYFTMNYGEVKTRKTKNTIKRNNVPSGLWKKYLLLLNLVIAIPRKNY